MRRNFFLVMTKVIYIFHQSEKIKLYLNYISTNVEIIIYKI